MDSSILFTIFTFGIFQSTVGGPVCWKPGQNGAMGELQCPQGEVLIASKQDNLGMVIKKYPCLYQHVGRNNVSIDKSPIDCTSESKDLPDDIEKVAEYFQCAPEANMINNCPPKLPRPTFNIVNGSSCGFIISCYTNFFNYDSCDQDKDRCTLYLDNYGYGVGNTLYAYVYYFNGTKSNLQYDHGEPGSLFLGHRIEYPKDRRFTLLVSSKDINLNFTIAYEVFSPGDEKRDININSWEPGECWKRKGVVNPQSPKMCPASTTPVTTTQGASSPNEKTTTEGGPESNETRPKVMWIIIGAAVGGFIILVLIITCCCCYKRRQRRNKGSNDKAEIAPNQNNTDRPIQYANMSFSRENSSEPQRNKRQNNVPHNYVRQVQDGEEVQVEYARVAKKKKNNNEWNGIVPPMQDLGENQVEYANVVTKRLNENSWNGVVPPPRPPRPDHLKNLN